MSTKIEQRRQQRIEEAIKLGDWEEVQRLLNQPLENARRRDRHHKSQRLDLERQNSKHKSNDSEKISSNAKTGEEFLLKTELQKQVKEALNTLSEIDKTIIIQKFFLNKSQKEIAKSLNISEVAISKRLKRALPKLGNSLTDYLKN